MFSPKRSFLAISACMLALAGCADEPTRPASAPATPSLSQTASASSTDTVPTYSQERPGTFVDMPDSLLWQHIEYSEGVAVVGLRKPGRNRGVYRGRVLMDRSQWQQSRHAVTSRPGVELIWADTLLPTVKVRFSSFDAFQKVRSLPVTAYIEPLRAIGDIPQQAEGSLGCGYGRWTRERLYTSDGDVYSIKHRAMGIENAWRRTSGAGITIGVIDTGILSAQTQLMPARYGGRFDAGASAGRSFKFRDAWSGSAEPYPQDQCGHGSKAAGVVAAPRDGKGSIGVAWKSNLVGVRLANGVVNVNANDAQHAIRNGLSVMDLQPGGKIVTMSWQSLNWWWQVSDEIDYWQNRHPNDLLFFGAAGTSFEDWQECAIGTAGGGGVGAIVGAVIALFSPYTAGIIWVWAAWGAGAGAVAGCVVPRNSNVVFPAQHSSVVAVTCLDYPVGNVSNNCHYGSKVEFGAYQSFTTVTDKPDSVGGLGGSSGATPTVAGQAALVWSKYPYMTRAQVLDRMRWAAQSKRDPHAGYGIVNSYKAVGGMYYADIIQNQVSGGGFNEVAQYELQPLIRGGDGPFTYRWWNGATTPTVRVAVGPGDPIHVYTVTITDQADGGTVSARTEIHPPAGGCADPRQIICD